MPMLPADRARQLGELVDKLLWGQPVTRPLKTERGEDLISDPYALYIMLYANRDKFLRDDDVLFKGWPLELKAEFILLSEKIIYDAALWNYTFGLPNRGKEYNLSRVKSGLAIEAYIGDGRKFHDEVVLLPESRITQENLSLTFDTLTQNPKNSELACSIVHITAKPSIGDAEGSPLLLQNDNILIIPFGTPFELKQHDEVKYLDWPLVGSGYIELGSDEHSIMSMSVTFIEQRPSLIQGS
jgi:hypothetical protein